MQHLASAEMNSQLASGRCDTILCGAGGSGGDGMPWEAVAYLGFMRVRILEELAFLNGSNFFEAMLHGGGGSTSQGTLPTHRIRCACESSGLILLQRP